MKILNIGSCNIDYFYEVEHLMRAGETITTHQLEVQCGGKGLNQSIAASKAGVVVYHAGIVGKDGDILKEALKESNVQCDYLIKSNHKTGHAIIQRERSGENCIMVYPGSNHAFTEEMIQNIINSFEPEDILIVQNETNLVREMLAKGTERGMTTILNPAPYLTNIKEIDLNTVNYIVINEVEGKDLTGYDDDEEIVSYLCDTYSHLKVILTQGSKGCLYGYQQQRIHQPAFKVNAIDTTAAGDTFIGYFAACLVRGLEVKKILTVASKASSITVTGKGSSNSIPSWDQVVAELKLD